MRKLTIIVISLFIAVTMAFPINAATLGYIDIQKVFSSYEKTKKAQENFKNKEQSIKDEIAKKQKQVEEEKSKGMSDKDIRKLVSKFEKEIEPKKAEIVESQKKIMQEIQDDIVRTTEATAKKMGLEIVLDKQIFITGGTDITDEVIKLLNKK
jgi:Skp family chaperone for outer membrane proteins